MVLYAEARGVVVVVIVLLLVLDCRVLPSAMMWWCTHRGSGTCHRLRRAGWCPQRARRRATRPCRVIRFHPRSVHAVQLLSLLPVAPLHLLHEWTLKLVHFPNAYTLKKHFQNGQVYFYLHKSLENAWPLPSRFVKPKRCFVGQP